MNNHRTIGQVAKEVGIPAKTIRYYEEMKLLQPAKRMTNKYREYSDEDIKRLHLIKQAKTLGLSLPQIKQLVEESMDGTCAHLREHLLAQIPAYIQEIKERIDELQELQQNLKELHNNLTHLQLTDPQKKVAEKNCCEVLEQMEQKIQKGSNL